MEDLKKSFLIHGSHIVGLSDKNFSTCPLGTVLSFAGQTAPHGYLLCDGASYKVADYPHLYAVIGNTYGGDSTNFNVPDFRETVLVGVGQNTTDTIATHDVYELGEFKDDQMQTHTHTVVVPDAVYQYTPTFAGGPGPNSKTTAGTSNNSGRSGTTTHGKQKGVTYIIKAFHTNEGVDSGVSDDVIDYVDGELATKKDVAKLLNNATDSTKWIKLKLGNSSTFQPIIISDQYGGKVEITGMANDGTYRSVKLVRYSYGDWTTHHATSFTTTSAGDGNYKIRRLYYYPTDGYYYLEIRQWATIKVEGSSTAEMITSLPAEASAMTLIPESNWGRIDDTSTGSTSTWSSSKIASVISPKANKQNAVRNTDYLKSDRPYLKIARNGSLPHVGYYTCETYMLCNHLGNMGALSFIRTDNGASCVYKDIVGTLSLSVEKYDEYICWLKYSSTPSEIITVYALNGYTPTVSAVTSTA